MAFCGEYNIPQTNNSKFTMTTKASGILAWNCCYCFIILIHLPLYPERGQLSTHTIRQDYLLAVAFMW